MIKERNDLDEEDLQENPTDDTPSLMAEVLADKAYLDYGSKIANMLQNFYDS